MDCSCSPWWSSACSKKDGAVRRKELLEVVSPPLLDYLQKNAATMCRDKASSVTISDILASACGDLRPAMTAVAQLANQELVPGGSNEQVEQEEPEGFGSVPRVTTEGQWRVLV